MMTAKPAPQRLTLLRPRLTHSVGGRISAVKTTWTEKFLLVTTVVLLPLQERLPSLFGFSFIYLIFAILGGYALLQRPAAMARAARHPVFLISFAFVAIATPIEYLNGARGGLAEYNEIVRVAEMILGGLLIASLCRDRASLRSIAYGILIAGACTSLVLVLTYYGILKQYGPEDFASASRVRDAVFSEENPLQANLNTIAFVTALGGVDALALALKTASATRRASLLLVALLCLIATFIPMSRGGVVIAVVGAAVVFLNAKGQRVRAMIAVVVLGLGVMMWVPAVTFSRLRFSTQAEEGKVDARARVYAAAVEDLPDYFITGVGAGNFWGWWGARYGFWNGYETSGAHNVFFQVTIYWGAAGLICLLLLCWFAFRCLPKQPGGDILALCLVGLATSSLLLSFVSHNLYAKQFSVCLGALVGASVWIWPKRRTVSGTLRRMRRMPPQQPECPVLGLSIVRTKQVPFPRPTVGNKPQSRRTNLVSRKSAGLEGTS